MRSLNMEACIESIVKYEGFVPERPRVYLRLTKKEYDQAVAEGNKILIEVTSSITMEEYQILANECIEEESNREACK